jgi:hypothetical protein
VDVDSPVADSQIIDSRPAGNSSFLPTNGQLLDGPAIAVRVCEEHK